MGIPSPQKLASLAFLLGFLLLKVEELAWLVRDNLHAKHLVLSFEELFVEFLECPLRFRKADCAQIIPAVTGVRTGFLSMHDNVKFCVSSEEEEGILALEPMQSYQRMLLHQLADLFGLAHESIGEGEERHLVVEKCEDSSIPAVLVSDILLNDDRDTQSPLSSKQVLKRDTTPRDGSPTPSASNTTASSLEERQAAYLAARERIFSATWKYGAESPKSTGLVRPRSDPVVARRMIAHALGKSKVLPFPSPTTDLTSPEDLRGLNQGVTPKSRGDSPGNEETSISIELKESMQQSSALAAKRIFANALSSSYAGSSPRLNLREVSCKTGTSIIVADHGEDTILKGIMPRSKNLTSTPPDSGENTDQGCPQSSENSSSTRPRRGTRNARPGGAACRIFAQALGLPDPASATDLNRPTSNHQRSSLGSSCNSWQR